MFDTGGHGGQQVMFLFRWRGVVFALVFVERRFIDGGKREHNA